jgi:4-amino-4-deoxy-L-arabinose transferase-like glycosyltransferase
VQPIRLSLSTDAEPRHPRLWPWTAGFLVVAAVFLGFDIAAHPIVLWDESRLAVNALEMSRRGFSLITTYGFQPDLWNTKPPLLIWLEAGSLRLFGPSEWALRLPSLLAALATVGLIMRFSWRLSRSRFVTVGAAAALVFSQGYFGEHAAQSGDYDTLLCFFTSAYLLLLFEVLHERRADAGRVLLCGVLVACACLTKGIAGLAPGVGAFAYVVVRGRWPRLFQTPWYALAGLIVVVLVGGYYLLRERAAPGYLAAVRYNELGYRYLHGMNGHQQPPYYYLQWVIELFSLGPLLLLLLIAPFLRWMPTRSAAFLTYAGFVVVTLLLVFSLSRTKIYWYIVPIYPIVSIALAIVVHRLLQMIPHEPGRAAGEAKLIVIVLALYMIAAGLVQKLSLIPPHELNSQGLYGEVFAQLDRQGVRRVATLDGGVYNNDGLVDYSPQRRFYSLIWAGRGMDIRIQDPDKPLALAAGEVLVTCDPSYHRWTLARGRSLTNMADCAAVASSSPPRAG